ncbi:hypothetical protein SDC9_44956 [bioreactor metagenome]|uniref:Uncharacterized protein n=1 Tax=bioreactor metagenome TaxID=1076179 RepID=A0A644W4S7_9ZZZZ
MRSGNRQILEPQSSVGIVHKAAYVVTAAVRKAVLIHLRNGAVLSKDILHLFIDGKAFFLRSGGFGLLIQLVELIIVIVEVVVAGALGIHAVHKVAGIADKRIEAVEEDLQVALGGFRQECRAVHLVDGHVDVDLLQSGLDSDSRLFPVGKAVAQGHRAVKSVGVAGLGEQFLGLFDVRLIAGLIVADVSAHVIRKHGGCAHRVAGHDLVHEVIIGDQAGYSLADLNVVEGSDIIVHAKEQMLVGRVLNDRNALLGGNGGDILLIQVESDIYVAVLQKHLAVGGFWNQFIGHGAVLSFCVAPIGISAAGQNHGFGSVVGGNLIGAGAAGIGGKEIGVAGDSFLSGGFVYDTEGIDFQQAQEHIAPLAQGENNRLVVGSLHVGDVGQSEEEAGVGIIAAVLEGPDNVRRGHLVAARKGGCRIQMEGPDQAVLAGLPALSQVALKFAGVGDKMPVLIDGGGVLDQTVINGVLERGGGGIGLIPGIQSVAKGCGRNHDAGFSRGGRGCAGSRGARGVCVACACAHGKGHGYAKDQRGELLQLFHCFLLFFFIIFLAYMKPGICARM